MSLEFQIGWFTVKLLIWYKTFSSNYIFSLKIWRHGKEYKVLHWWKHTQGHILYFFNKKKKIVK